MGIVVADCVARPVLRQPQKGRLELVEEVGLYAGGSAASTGYGLARFGIATAVVGRVGADGFGDFLLAEAARHGADASLMRRDPSAATSATLVIVDQGGERTFLHAIGANARLTPDDVPLESLRGRGASLLHLGGFFGLPGMEGSDGAPACRLFEQATRLGFATSLDCLWDPGGRWQTLIGGLLAHTDYFCPSIHEARALCGLSANAAPDEVARAVLDFGVRGAVALKMGEDGCYLRTAGGEFQQFPVVPVRVVDGTGSGDAFIAGFLAALLKGHPPLDAARYGNAAGAMCVREVGAMAGITDWDEAEGLARRLLTPPPSP